MAEHKPASTFDLTVVGDASIDYFVRVPHIAGNDNKAIGTLVGIFGGGMSANLAAAAAVQGVQVQLITKTGFGHDSEEALRELEGLGVATGNSVHDSEHRTWMCFVQLDDSGEKALTGADTGIKLPMIEEITPTTIQNSRIVAPLADDLLWALQVARPAKDSGALIAIDLEPDAFEPSDPELAELLGLTDIVFINAASARKFSADDPVAAAQALHALGPDLVVVSDGPGGAYASSSDGEVYRAQLTDAVHAVDTTGAGDALAGAFLGSRLAGETVQRSLERAVAQASASVTRVGSRTYLADEATPPDHFNFTEHLNVTSERHHP